MTLCVSTCDSGNNDIVMADSAYRMILEAYRNAARRVLRAWLPLCAAQCSAHCMRTHDLRVGRALPDSCQTLPVLGAASVGYPSAARTRC